MARGIVETLGLAGSVLFAAPVGLLGAQFLLDGRLTWGVTFLGLAALMLVVPRYVVTPWDFVGETLEAWADLVAKTDDEDEKR